jgi:hypothetical protein
MHRLHNGASNCIWISVIEELNKNMLRIVKISSNVSEIVGNRVPNGVFFNGILSFQIKILCVLAVILKIVDSTPANV